MSEVDEHWLWLRRIAGAILEAEKPAAMSQMEKLPSFQKEAFKAIEHHRKINELISRFHYTNGARPDPIVLVGSWSEREEGAVAVVEMPSLRRRPEIEEQLASLGKILAGGLNGLFLSCGPGYAEYRLVWCNDDNQEWNISAEEDLVALLLDMRTERATDGRYRQVMDALKVGTIPPR